jgi:divalent metal cation (Fe/Co/Zn/Cd) transporter
MKKRNSNNSNEDKILQRLKDICDVVIRIEEVENTKKEKEKENEHYSFS